jgi:hypothetical protein
VHTALEVTLIIASALSFTAMCMFAVLTVVGRKPGLPIQPSLLQSPFNYLFYPSRLTSNGQRNRKRCFLFALVFLSVVVCDIVVFGTRTI